VKIRGFWDIAPCVVSLEYTDVSEVRTASITRVNNIISHNIFLLPSEPVLVCIVYEVTLVLTVKVSINRPIRTIYVSGYW
jgi:hypothetical protein